jgi:hypothetical protein
MRLEGEIGWKTTMVLLRAVFVFQNSAPVSNFSKLKIILHSELGHMCIDFIFFFFCIICLSNFRSTAMREEINRKP